MLETETIHVIGHGAVGLPLAAFLTRAGRQVVAVRVRHGAAPEEYATVAVNGPGGESTRTPVRLASLASLPRLDGLVVVATKAPANAALAAALRERECRGPVAILQNGIGIEEPFLAAGFSEVYRGVLYLTSQAEGPCAFTFRTIASCPLGLARGSRDGLAECVAALSTPALPFHADAAIDRAVWKKAITNAVFNSLCPLLDTDNGVFARDPAVAELARQVVRECLPLATAQGNALSEAEILDQIMQISRGSAGVLISTLQDLRRGRETEIESLNLAMARMAARHTPPLMLPRTELLGRLILARSRSRPAPVPPPVDP